MPLLSFGRNTWLPWIGAWWPKVGMGSKPNTAIRAGDAPLHDIKACDSQLRAGPIHQGAGAGARGRHASAEPRRQTGRPRALAADRRGPCAGSQQTGRARLPDGRHRKVQLHEDGAKGQQPRRQEQHGRVRGPVRRRHVARDLVGARGVGLDLLLGRPQAACAAAPPRARRPRRAAATPSAHARNRAAAMHGCRRCWRRTPAVTVSPLQ